MFNFLCIKQTDGRGNYNEKVLEKLMTKSKTREVSSNTHTVIEKCKKEGGKIQI